MLIPSPRITGADMAVWTRREAFDRRLAADPRLTRLEDAAKDTIARFLDGGDAFVGVSWGKDSVVAAHLALTVQPGLRLVWVRARDVEPPESVLVRDWFLSTHPGARYEERVGEFRVPLRGEPGFECGDPTVTHQDMLGETLTGRRITGLRAEESRTRRMSIGARGANTAMSCRPIGTWSAVDVFAYLHREELPVHPVYAMSRGGWDDRRWLRVHPLMTEAPAAVAARGGDPAAWEDTYYPDVCTAALTARAHLWAG